MRTWTSCSFFALGLLTSPSLGGAEEPFPLSEVKAGLVGAGRTVFEGSKVEEFQVHVLGVLDNAVGPRRSIILARLAGGPLANTGVLQGMSGSPVYVDGRLLGAVAYSFAFAKEPIAGITPWQDMLEGGAARVSGNDTGHTPPARTSAVRFPLSTSELLSRLTPDGGTFTQATARPAAVGALQALVAPLVLTGFEPVAAEWTRSVLAPFGLAAVTGGGASAHDDGFTPLPLEAGSPLAISLIQGDLDLSATGTATAVVGGRVYAFGHGFQNLGSIRLPLRRARVISSVPSVQQSWKAAIALDTVGTFDQDRSTGVAGTLGLGPTMVPVALELRSSAGASRDLSFELAEDETLTPLLAYAALYSALQSAERARGAVTVTVGATIELTDGRVVRVADMFADDQPALKAAGVVAAPMVLLLGNGFEPVRIRKVTVRAALTEERRSATLVRAWVEPAGHLRPGTKATLFAIVRTHRGDPRVVSLPLALPSSLSLGQHTLLLGGADAMTAEDQRLARDGLVPQSLNQLVHRLNELRSHDRLYARLVESTPGTIAGGERMPSLPSSMRSLLSASDQGGSIVSVPSAPAWEGEVPLDMALEGARTLSLYLER
jgi:hypothetical protein